MCHHIWHVGLTREKWLKPKIVSTLHHRIKEKKTHKSFNWVNDEERKEKEEKEKEEEEDDNI